MVAAMLSVLAKVFQLSHLAGPALVGPSSLVRGKLVFAEIMLLFLRLKTGGNKSLSEGWPSYWPQPGRGQAARRLLGRCGC